MGFQMWTFMQPSVYPMGLWIFAFIAVEALRPAEEPAVGRRPGSARRARLAVVVSELLFETDWLGSRPVYYNEPPGRPATTSTT